MQFTVLPRHLCPSVRVSDKRVDSDKMKETCAHNIILHERPFILVFWQEEWLVGRPLLPEILGQTVCFSENADFQLTFAHSASAVTPSGNRSINTNRQSTTRFPMSLR